MRLLFGCTRRNSCSNPTIFALTINCAQYDVARKTKPTQTRNGWPLFSLNYGYWQWWVVVTYSHHFLHKTYVWAYIFNCCTVSSCFMLYLFFGLFVPRVYFPCYLLFAFLLNVCLSAYDYDSTIFPTHIDWQFAIFQMKWLDLFTFDQSMLFDQVIAIRVIHHCHVSHCIVSWRVSYHSVSAFYSLYTNVH